MTLHCPVQFRKVPLTALWAVAEIHEEINQVQAETGDMPRPNNSIVLCHSSFIREGLQSWWNVGEAGHNIFRN